MRSSRRQRNLEMFLDRLLQRKPRSDPAIVIPFAATARLQEALTQDQQQHLPYELLLHIFSYLDDRNDLCTLCQCSKAFRETGEGYLYRSINLRFEATFGHLTRASKILETIKNRRYSNIVRELRVYLEPCRVTHMLDAPPQECICSEVDGKLGKALLSLHALEVLRITCRLCVNLSVGRHHYLTELPSRSVRKLHYVCDCARGGGFDATKLFLAPWMRSITALNWARNIWTAVPDETLQKLMKDPSFLANVDTVHYHGSGITEELLTKRNIRRISSSSTYPFPPIGNHPNKAAVTHLSIAEHALMIFVSAVGSINQFSNLQHIGTLTFARNYHTREESVPDIVKRSLDHIVDLKQLVSIEGYASFFKGTSDEDNPCSPQLFTRLEKVYPKLRRVFLSGGFSCVWILREDSRTWEECSLPQFTSWDLITGVYDDL